jgi:hypothetical protein
MTTFFLDQRKKNSDFKMQVRNPNKP